jgi:hypothetical protein
MVSKTQIINAEYIVNFCVIMFHAVFVLFYH